MKDSWRVKGVRGSALFALKGARLPPPVPDALDASRALARMDEWIRVDPAGPVEHRQLYEIASALSRGRALGPRTEASLREIVRAAVGEGRLVIRPIVTNAQLPQTDIRLEASGVTTPAVLPGATSSAPRPLVWEAGRSPALVASVHWTSDPTMGAGGVKSSGETTTAVLPQLVISAPSDEVRAALRREAIAGGIPPQWADSAAELDYQFRAYRASGVSEYSALFMASARNPKAAAQLFAVGFKQSDLKPFLKPFDVAGSFLSASSNPKVKALGLGLVALGKGGEMFVTLVKVANGEQDPMEAAVDLLADQALDEIADEISERYLDRATLKAFLSRLLLEVVKHGASELKRRQLEEFFEGIHRGRRSGSW
jgi:hypothetical protein